jgi:anti-sigma factor RsiW
MADYLGGDLSPDTLAVFERHLTICADCMAYLSDYEATIKAGKRAFAQADNELPPGVPEDLIKAILAARPR